MEVAPPADDRHEEHGAAQGESHGLGGRHIPAEAGGGHRVRADAEAVQVRGVHLPAQPAHHRPQHRYRQRHQPGRVPGEEGAAHREHHTGAGEQSEGEQQDARPQLPGLGAPAQQRPEARQGRGTRDCGHPLEPAAARPCLLQRAAQRQRPRRAQQQGQQLPGALGPDDVHPADDREEQARRGRPQPHQTDPALVRGLVARRVGVRVAGHPQRVRRRVEGAAAQSACGQFGLRRLPGARARRYGHGPLFVRATQPDPHAAERRQRAVQVVRRPGGAFVSDEGRVPHPRTQLGLPDEPFHLHRGRAQRAQTGPVQPDLDDECGPVRDGRLLRRTPAQPRSSNRAVTYATSSGWSTTSTSIRTRRRRGGAGGPAAGSGDAAGSGGASSGVRGPGRRRGERIRGGGNGPPVQRQLDGTRS